MSSLEIQTDRTNQDGAGSAMRKGRVENDRHMETQIDTDKKMTTYNAIEERELPGAAEAK